VTPQRCGRTHSEQDPQREAETRFAAHGLASTAEVGEARPVEAVAAVLDRRCFAVEVEHVIGHLVDA